MAQLPKLSRLARISTDLDLRRKPPAGSSNSRKPDEKSTSWKEIKQFVRENLDKQNATFVDGKFQELWSKTKELTAGEESAEFLEDSVIFLLKLFMNQKMVLLKHTTEMKRIFGTVTNSQVNKIWQIIREIEEKLNQDCRNFLENLGQSQNTPQEHFGSTIKCQLPTDYFQDTAFLQDLLPKLSTKNKVVENFTMKYEDVVPSTSGYQKSQESQKSSKYNRAWLTKHVNPDLIEALVDLLKSSRTNDELQNELFDFLGFDKFEAIQEMLENRKLILKTLELEQKKEIMKEKIQQNNGVIGPAPAFLIPVIVQSEKEKELMKQVRKDEKRLKSMKNALKDDEEEEELTVAKLRLSQTQNFLKLAQREPIFTEKPNIRVAPTPTQVRYPNVYDQSLEARAHIGFATGGKILLPESTERKDTKMYEQVSIPANESATLTVGNTRVQVESLDEIGRIAFQGTKELNRIQSIVYPTAYHTNENLLICAPTGAGKTNVAMLTIINTIRAHTDQGVIHRDKFKIVYVAPMKALAAEMTENFGKRLKPLQIQVKELTGDMQLTKKEMQATQMLVTTPEKWDVVTRKGAGDASMISLVKLLIIDEVHLLHGERGPVVEALVARTLRLVETSQSMIRIVGLSATLPNYVDVARFLRVNLMNGLFFFDSRFRPIPLSQQFIGVKGNKQIQIMSDMDVICFDKCVEQLRKGHQVMVFVHARNATVRTATVLRDMAQQKGLTELFCPSERSPQLRDAMRTMAKSRNRQLNDLFQSGFAMHHAGMLRSDRNLVERYFGEGLVKVLVCTATLAWGINLPAHAVIIKGTEIYDSKHGSFVDLGILDVLQIFGRAGRPQFDKSGEGIIITTHEKLNHYLSLLTNQFPIESNFVQCLADNLNAEVALGTISNVDEAIEWLSYTYLFVRMRINPQVYGLNYEDVNEDPSLEMKRRKLIYTAAMALDKARMVRFNERTGDLNITDLGRTASHFYIKYDTVEVFNEMLRPIMTEAEVLNMMANAQEFQQLKVRDEEMDELDDLTHDFCEVPVKGGAENIHGKINILMQTYLSGGQVKSFSLISDMSYINQNAVRIARGLFQIILRNNNAILASRMLMISKMFERKMWDYKTPMRQFGIIPWEVLQKIEDRGMSVDQLRDMDEKEIGEMLRNHRYGKTVRQCAWQFPLLEVEATLHPITRTVLKIRIFITASFKWNDRLHGKCENFWIWIEDTENNFIYHSEYFQITKQQVVKKETQEVIMTIPLKDPLPSQYIIKVISDTWLGSSRHIPLSFKHLILPELHPPHTDLLPLEPLPVTVLQDKSFEKLYKFTHFNPIQTQIFHCCYHTDKNVLLGAPTGSGKTIVAEIAMFRVFKNYPKSKVVYIAPLKALVKERMSDWKVRLEEKLGKKVVELTGDVSPDIKAIREAQVIVTTPEKWDGISRSWQTRDYVRDVALIVIDEIHLLGEDRGPVLEVIVSRTNFISSHTEKTLRIIGLSTALANAKDLANWLGIGQMGLYNFKPSVRPVPLAVHINGFPGQHYCPRMATMNRPVFQAIRQYSPCTPAMVFVSSRRQTRLTALDLIAYLAGEQNPKQFVHMPDDQVNQILQNIKDENLKLTLAFGIGIHHAGLHERDRKTTEELFLNRKIQILIATATLAWGVNLPAHLVVIKGTEYFDGKLKRYVDMPITDVLQMMGRAGRPQFDNEGIACVFVHDVKKNFYKKFLYDPFPVESCLLKVLADHANAEIVAGTVTTKQGILDYLTWTFFFRRLIMNPTYYGLNSPEPEDVNLFLSTLVQNVLETLYDAGCIGVDEDNRTIYPTSMGRISSYYYLSYKTMRDFADKLSSDNNFEAVLQIMCNAHEFSEHPVRHNEDKYNAELAADCRLKVDPLTYDNPHTKVFLLMQAHMSHLALPNTDFGTDTKSVLDQAIRILQAMIDVAAERGWLATTLRIQLLMQSTIQARWHDESVFLCLPNVEPHNCYVFDEIKVDNCSTLTLPILKEKCRRNYEVLAGPLRQEFDEAEIEQIYKVLKDLPTVKMDFKIRGAFNELDNIERSIPQPPNKNDWLEVNASEEYTLIVNLQRLGARSSEYMHCPKFPKPKSEGWFLVLGCQENGELLAMKRCAYRANKSTHHLLFTTPNKRGRIIYTLYFVSDGYLGLDQQYNLQFQVLRERAGKFPQIDSIYDKL